MKNLPHAYHLAQRAIADLKTSIYIILSENNEELKNSEVGRKLGIYQGHSGKHEGHISRVLLEIMQSEGLIVQNEANKKWSIKNNE